MLTPAKTFGRTISLVLLAAPATWVLLGVAILLLPAPAHGQLTPVGSVGSGDGPAQQLPANNDVTDGTDNTDVGLLQVEVGSVFTRSDATAHSETLPLTFRYGAFTWLELSAGTDGYVWQRASDQGPSDGVGNVLLAARVRLFGHAGGLPVLALVPQLTLPTASPLKGLGTGSPDFLVAAIMGRDYPVRSHVDVSYGAGALGQADGLPHLAQQIAFVSGSLGVTPAWTPGLTLTWISRQDAVTGGALLLSGDTVVTLSRRLALDVSAQFGLTRQSPSFELASGLSFVLGTLDADDGVHARRHKLRFRSRRRSRRP